MLRAVAAAGVAEIDVTSFVPAQVVPQFADAEEVLGSVPDGVTVRVLTVNVRGRRAGRAGSRARCTDRPVRLPDLSQRAAQHRQPEAGPRRA